MAISESDPRVESRRRMLHATANFGLLSIRERSLQKLLDEATRLAREALETDAAKVLELRPNGSLLVRAGVGWPPGVVGAVEIALGRLERGVTPRRDPVSLVGVLRDLIEQGRVSYPAIQFLDELPAESMVETDEDLARLVLANIVDNAAKYSSVRPEVVVRLERSPAGWLARVRDGCGGINAPDLDRLFERYFRGQSASEFRGFGLGLFVAHRSAESLGWHIDVKNSGVGCEFLVTIPSPQTTE